MGRAAPRKSPSGGDLHRNWSFQPDTLNEKERTVEAIAATETPVRQWYGYEILRCTDTAVVTTRLAGLPVIDSHDRSSVLNILGQVTEYRFEKRQLVVRIRFAEGERGQAALDLVKSGMLSKVSVGYRIHEYEEADARDGSAIQTATLWEPYEVSLVSVPADHNASIRGKNNMAKAVKRVRRPVEADPVHDSQSVREVETDEDEIDNIDEIETRSAPRRSTFERRLDALMGEAIRAGLPVREVEEELDGVRSIERARAIVFDMLAERQNQTRTVANHGADNARQRGDGSDERIVDALAVRMGAKPADMENPLRNVSLVQIGRQAMENAGISTRSLDDVAIAEFMVGRRSPNFATDGTRAMHTTSDFPLLLQSAGNRALLDRYGFLASPLKGLSTKRNARDFRTQTFIRPGEAPKLLKVSEAGEITSGTMEEDARGLKLDTYARKFAISRQAIINDDLGAFSDFIMAFAQSAAETEGDLFFALLSANAYGGTTLSDGKNLSHADHGNKAAAGGEIDESTVSEARKAMRLQKNVNGTGTAGVVPAVLLVGPARETEAEKFVTTINATTTGDANPFAGKLQVEVENRYSGNGWWLFADPQQRPALMHGYLTGSEGPIVETKDGWDVLGTEFRCILDFGCGVMDYRAAYFNPGT